VTCFPAVNVCVRPALPRRIYYGNGLAFGRRGFAQTSRLSCERPDVAYNAAPGVVSAVGPKAKLRKDTDYVTRFRRARGIGILREEVWLNSDNEVVKYNLAFLLPHVFARDNGRVLGYDNTHGVHERHDYGSVEGIQFRNYPSTAARFYKEVARLRSSYEKSERV
jgi:hypothetical protein